MSNVYNAFFNVQIKFKNMSKAKVPVKSGSKVSLISSHAKSTRKEGEKWTDAISRAAKELKAQGKI